MDRSRLVTANFQVIRRADIAARVSLPAWGDIEYASELPGSDVMTKSNPHTPVNWHLAEFAGIQ
jgi:hypothetical protein